jgi:hypothetical protein
MTVQLRVWGLGALDSAGGGVSVLGGDHVLGVLFHDLAAVATPHDGHLLSHVVDRLLDGPGVGLLDLLPLPRVAERPYGRDGLRCAERHVDPTTTATAGTLRTKPPAAARVTALHQGDEIHAIHRRAGLNPEALQGLGIGQPAARGLRHLPIGCQVVVPALGLHRLALQVARVPTAPRRTYARRGHHMGDDPQRAEPAKQFAQRSLCHGTAVHVVCTGFLSCRGARGGAARRVDRRGRVERFVVR